MANFLTKRIAFIGLFLMLAIQMLCYNYINYIQMEPRSIHSWRQADCLSFVINFYNGRTTFFEPGVSNLGPTGDGKIASDFPIIQYSVAQLWKITGISTPLYRLINLSFLVLGLFYIYKLYCYWFEDRYWLALLTIGLIFTSTLLAYYGPTSLSDIQALGLSCVGFYYFMIWLDHKEKRHLLISLAVFSLAGLLKMSAAFIFVIALGYWFVRIIWGELESKKGLSSLPIVILLFSPFIPWGLWYLYAGYYNQIHPNDYFLIGICPIWIVPSIYIGEVFMVFTKDFLPIVMNVYFLAFFALILLIGFVTNIRSFFKEYYLRMLIPILVGITFFLLFFEVFGEHDYYLINMLPVLMIVIGLLVKYILVHYPHFFNYKVVQWGLVLMIVVFTHQTAVFTRARIEMQGWGFDSLVLSQERHDYFVWNTWYDRSHYEVLETIPEESLNSIGLTKDKKVLCIGDLTINKSLYLLNRIGYTSFRQKIDSPEALMALIKAKGIDYLIVIDWNGLSPEKMTPYLKNKVYEKETTLIFKL